MELIELQALVGNFDDLQKKVIAQKAPVDTAEYIKQYDPKQHDITDKAKRPDKIINTEAGPGVVPVARLPIAMQKRIVSRSATFLCGNPIKLLCNPADQTQIDMRDMVQRSWDDNKLDYEGKVIAKLMMSVLEVAEIWYYEQVDPTYWIGTPNEGSQYRLRMKIVSTKYGDSLYPVFNNAGDMIAFGRGYFLKEGDKNIEHFDLYTDTATYLGVKGDAGWTALPEANPVGKIPVIYYRQELPEWSDVQELIDRLERSASNHADTNDYFGSPMVIVKGEVKGFSQKGEQGKVLELMNGAEADYLSWDQSPESVKLEQENLKALIYDLTDTPNISFEQVSGLGTFSGIALKMLFMGAHMKASEKEETFGKSVQRRINFMKASMAKINVKLEPATGMTIKPGFEYYLPKNTQEVIETLIAATGSKPILSRKTAVSLNPLVEDAKQELVNLEEDDKAGLDTQFNV